MIVRYNGDQVILINSSNEYLFKKFKGIKNEDRLEVVIDHFEQNKKLPYYQETKNNKDILSIPSILFKKNFFQKYNLWSAKEKQKNKEENKLELIKGVSYVKKVTPSLNLIQKNKYIKGMINWSSRLTKLKTNLEWKMTSFFQKRNFEEVTLSKITPWETWIKTGHLLNHYSEIFPVFKTKNDQNLENIFIKSYFEDRKPEFSNENLVSIGGLTYSQCENFWSNLEGSERSISEKDLPLYLYDKSGKSYRQERNNIEGLRRLSEFHRAELIFIDHKERLILFIEKFKEEMSLYFKELGLVTSISKVDSWSGAKTHCYTYDFEVEIDNKLIEIANISLNCSHYCSKFTFLPKDVYSGCSGWGIDRILSCLIDIYGIEETEKKINS